MNERFTREAAVGSALARTRYAELDKVLVTQSAWAAFVLELVKLAGLEERIAEESTAK